MKTFTIDYIKSFNASANYTDFHLPDFSFLKNCTMRLALIVPAILLILNGLIYLQTEKKIQFYSKNPPFMSYDFTDSINLNSDSKIQSLLDQNPATKWIKMRNAVNHQENNYDFSVELRLSHFYKNGYKPEFFKKIILQSCAKTHQRIKLTLFLHEAINVDKELRMPEEKNIGHYLVELLPGEKKEIDISREYKPENTSHFPENINIIGVKGKIKGERGCFSDIYLAKD